MLKGNPMRTMTVLTAAALMASPAFAGDPEAGEREWRQCRACHMIVDDAGNDIQRGGRVGPNLYGIIGRTAGTVEGFRYSPDMEAAGAAGLEWDEETFVAYVQDPTGFLREYTGNSGARGSMAFQMRSGAEDMFAYLESLAQ